MATRASGFTIIETMLFLGLTGLMLAGLLAGVTSGINIQRYNDASQTLKNLIHEQYAASINVQNSREDNQWRCNTVGGVVNDPVSGDLRGQSRCVMLGRYLIISDTETRSYPVTAYKRSDVDAPNDVESLRVNYAINIAKTNVDEGQLEWGTRIAWPKSGSGSRAVTTPRSIGILIIRSPDSGQTYTFTSNDVPSKSTVEALSPGVAPTFLSDMLVAGSSIPGQHARTVCIEPNGLGIGHRLAVNITGYASSSSAVSLISNETLRAEGGSGASQC
jgi:type II secretory pathway pseudopilin PulG